MPINENLPKFIGIISQHYKFYKGKPKLGYEIWLKKIPEITLNHLIPILKKHSSRARNLVIPNKNSLTLSQIPDFQSLGTLVQIYGIPVYSIKQEHTKILTDNNRAWAGVSWTDAQARMADYQQRYDSIITKLENAKL